MFAYEHVMFCTTVLHEALEKEKGKKNKIK